MAEIKLLHEGTTEIHPQTEVTAVIGLAAALNEKSKVEPLTTDPAAGSSELKGLKIDNVDYKIAAGNNPIFQGAAKITADQTATGYIFGTKELITKEYLDKVIQETITNNLNGNY